MSYYKSAKTMYEEDYGNYTDLYTKEGGNFYNMIYPTYVRFSYLTQLADEICKKTNMPDALENGYSEYVEKIADTMGLTRKQATYAEVPVIFTGTAGETIKKGFVVGTLDKRLYYTTTELTIGNDGTVKGIVKAELEGNKYNVKAHEIRYIPAPVKYIISVDNEEAYNDAYDRESDESLAERYYNALRNNKTSGNVAHYKDWALNVQGCGYCRVIPRWDKSNGHEGDGTVKLIIANSNKREANAELIQKVKDYIANDKDGSGEAPIGVALTVVSFTEKGIDINVDVLLDKGYSLDDIKTEIETVLSSNLENLDIDITTVRLFDIIKSISKIDGIIDVDNLKLNGVEDNISINNDEIPVLGTLTVGEITI